MPELPDAAENAAEDSRLKARRLLRHDGFWFSAALFMLALGLIGRFGINWAVWTGLATIAAITAYGYLPSVKARKHHAWELDRESLLEKWSLVVAKLAPPSRSRYQQLHLAVSRLGDLHPPSRRGSLLRPGEYLLWLYLKLLLARDLLEEGNRTSSEAAILQQRDRILAELQQHPLTPASRQSKDETILILDQRLETARGRAGRTQEIESDLTRIEQKLALMVDRAAQHNTMGDAARRIHFSDEVQTGASLTSLMGALVEELDAFVTAQVCA